MIPTDTVLSDAELCSRVRAGDRTAADQIINRHTAAVIRQLDKLKPPAFIDYDMLVSVGLQSLWNAAKHFDPSRGFKFITFAWKIISNDLRREIGRQLGPVDEEGDPLTYCFSQCPLNEGNKLSDLIPAREEREMDPRLKDWLDGLPPVQREVVTAAFGMHGRFPGWGLFGERLGLSAEQAKQVYRMATGKEPPTAKEMPRSYHGVRNRKRRLAVA